MYLLDPSIKRERWKQSESDTYNFKIESRMMHLKKNCLKRQTYVIQNVDVADAEEEKIAEIN